MIYKPSLLSASVNGQINLATIITTAVCCCTDPGLLVTCTQAHKLICAVLICMIVSVTNSVPSASVVMISSSVLRPLITNEGQIRYRNVRFFKLNCRCTFLARELSS